MNYQGTIIAESLGDESILQEVNIVSTKVEVVTEKHKTPWLSQWTLHSVKIPEKNADAFSEKISQSFDKHHPNWFVDYKNNLYHFVIFSQKIFKVGLANPTLYKDAKTYGMSIGIPDYQLEFGPVI